MIAQTLRRSVETARSSRLRDGEARRLRWRYVDPEASPLGRLTIVASYDNDTTKTEAERRMPVHPVLGTSLRDWQRSGGPP
jgi:integrase